jgi:hypothetical protein
MNSPLLPQDRYLAQLLGITEDELRYFKAEVQKRALEGPQPTIIAGGETLAIISLISTIISVGLTIVSLFLPKPKQGQLTNRQVEGETLRTPALFAPTYGFESVQDIAPLGDPIPLVYAKREFIDGQWYGGVRLSTPLLWSQMWSLGGSQLLRGVFLVGEGEIESIHPNSFAIGNNTLAGYALEGTTKRIAIYWRPNGGRMNATDLLAGATDDIGARGDYAEDIFTVDAGQDELMPAFCGAYKPSTSTSFGIYSPIANGLGYRVNPQIRPLRQLLSSGEKYDADDDAQGIATAWKYKYIYSSKSGIVLTSKGSTPGLIDLEVGDTFVYLMSKRSDGVLTVGSPPPKIVIRAQDNTSNSKGSQDGEETLIAVGASVAGRQKQYDAALVEGEMYKIGSCLAILTDRSELFVSEADYSVKIYSVDQVGEDIGVDALYQFKVVREGTVGVIGQTEVQRRFFTASRLFPRLGTEDAGKVWDYQTVGLNLSAGQIGLRHYTASSFPQIYRCALGGFTINRSAKFFEVGIKSVVGINIQGICNFADIPTSKQEFSTFVTALFYVSRTGATLPNGSYTLTASGGSGTGLQVTIVIASGNPTSTTIINGGSGYEEEDDVSFSTGGATFNYEVVEIDFDDTGFNNVSGYESINWKAADSINNKKIKNNLSVATYVSGSLSVPEKRYSFFRVLVRSKPDPETPFETSEDVVFGVGSAKQTAIFNFMRFRMSTEEYWEVRFEPVTSWEIRNSELTFVVLETGASEDNVNTATLELPFDWGDLFVQGRILTELELEDIFKIESLDPLRETGISWTEGDYSSTSDGTYIDRFARVAEFFVYDEITTSCNTSPEHEITYVNVIQENEAAPQYDNISLIGLNIRASQEWSQFAQFSSYITGGRKVDRFSGVNEATHLLPEVLYNFMLDPIAGLGNEISVNQINVESFAAATQFCYDNRFFYDGPKINNTNWRQWAADVAATHCLLLIERGGIFYMEQAIPEFPVIKGIFTAGNCLSMEMQSADVEQRQPFSVSVKYRTERYRTDAPFPGTEFNYGIFPEPQERLVYHTEWGDGPPESIDISEYCTSEIHAIKAARYIIGARKISDHTIKIKTTHEALTSPLAPGDFVKIALNYTYYSNYVNGVVLADGSLVTSSDLTDGVYDVIFWNGESATEVAEGVLEISGEGTVASPAGIIFTLKTEESTVRTYRIDSIQPTEDGYEIDTIYTPTLPDGRLKLYAEWSDDSYWTVA